MEILGQVEKEMGKKKVGGRFSVRPEWAEKQELGTPHQCWSGQRNAR